MKIDFWSTANFYINTNINGVVSNLYTLNIPAYSDAEYTGSICAGCDNEAFYDIYQTYVTTESLITINLTTDLPISDNQAYWGFNNF